MLPDTEKSMRIPSAGAFAMAALLCATPLTLQGSQGRGVSLSISSAKAADLELRIHHHRTAYRHHYARYSRLYNPWCDGPYTGGGIGDFNGGTYYGGPWIDLRCYDGVY
jgi:hypothetical protein